MVGAKFWKSGIFYNKIKKKSKLLSFVQKCRYDNETWPDYVLYDYLQQKIEIWQNFQIFPDSPDFQDFPDIKPDKLTVMISANTIYALQCLNITTGKYINYRV